MSAFAEHKFISTYYLAAHTREKVLVNDPTEFVTDFFDPEYQADQYLQPSKQTLLHDFIDNEFSDGVEYSQRMLGDDTNVPEWKKYLDSYKIIYLSYKEFYKKEGYPPEEDSDEHDYEYSEYLSNLVIKEASKHVVNETFSVLFGDRKFLMEFNLLLSETVNALKKANYPNLLEKDGVVKRCTYWPTWVERALTYRDQGSCAICIKDISGLLRTDFTRAVDHIVPLKLGGTNDITNFQLLCQECNLKKLDHTVTTSDYYVNYF